MTRVGGRFMLVLALPAAAGCAGGSSTAAHAGAPLPAGGLQKIEDVVVYRDDLYYNAFPSLVVQPGGEILCAFRRAPDRKRRWGAPRDEHTDPNAHLVLVRSRDGGRTWSREPELIFAHPLGGSQDPCMVRLRDGSIVCTSYGWSLLPPDGLARMDRIITHPPFGMFGGYLMRSDDGARTWKGPFTPPPIEGNQSEDVLGRPLPTYNRGAMVEHRDGALAWAVVRHEVRKPRHASVHLLTSRDRGETWAYAGPVAADAKVTFNETSLIETAEGDLVAYMRTAYLDGRMAVARAPAGGVFGPWEDTGVFGFPAHATHLPDGRILLVYGYRQAPFGIRARILPPDGGGVGRAAEFVIRDDGGTTDLGYPWAAVRPDGKIVVAYYMNVGDGPRHIAASILAVDGPQ